MLYVCISTLTTAQHCSPCCKQPLLLVRIACPAAQDLEWFSYLDPIFNHSAKLFVPCCLWNCSWPGCCFSIQQGCCLAVPLPVFFYRLLHYYMPHRDVLFLHSGCNIGKERDVTLFLGLSGMDTDMYESLLLGTFWEQLNTRAR